jgi:hypothetical protein
MWIKDAEADSTEEGECLDVRKRNDYDNDK